MHMSACTTEEIFGIYFCTEGTSLYLLNFLLCGVTCRLETVQTSADDLKSE